MAGEEEEEDDSVFEVLDVFVSEDDPESPDAESFVVDDEASLLVPAASPSLGFLA